MEQLQMMAVTSRSIRFNFSTRAASFEAAYSFIIIV